MSETKKNLIKNIIITLLYAIFTLIVVLHHEIWVDEAQVWLLVKHLNIFELFNHLVNEGHPSFFYLLIMPFAKIGLPILAMQIVCWLSMVASVFLLLEYSPFNKFTKFAIIMSAGFLYYLPVIARSYSIIPLLMFLIAILYPKQQNHPILYTLLLVFLANTHVIMFVFCLCLALKFLYDIISKKNTNKIHLFSLILITLGLTAVIVQLSGSIESNNAITFDIKNIGDNTKQVLSLFFLNITDCVSDSITAQQLGAFSKTAFFVATVEWIFFLLSFIALFFINKIAFTFGFFSIAFQFFIYIFSYNVMYPTRIFCALNILLFCFWISFKNIEIAAKRKLFIEIILSLIFVLTFMCSFKSIYADLKYPYSSSKNTAQFIKNEIDKKALIIPDIDVYITSVMVYLPDYNFYSIYYNKKLKFSKWTVTGFYSPYVISQLLEEEMEKQNNKNAYILSSSLLENFYRYDILMPDKYKLIYSSPPAIKNGEAYKIYKYIKKGE